ncbi:MAG: hypothetical protein OXC62_10495, partial [Aestuariivita sp.]|nr:hypothetical protein [Aestuariivita sp.]
ATLHQILEKRSLLSIQRNMIKLSSLRVHHYASYVITSSVVDVATSETALLKPIGMGYCYQ